MQLDRLSFSQTRHEWPDRFDSVKLTAARIEETGTGQFVVSRKGDEHGNHPVTLSTAFNHYWGHCACDRYQYHDGPCAHLCAVFRAQCHGLLSLPQLDIHHATGDLRDTDQARSAAAGHDEPEAIPDGGSL